MSQTSLLHCQKSPSNSSFFGHSSQRVHSQHPDNSLTTTTPIHHVNYVQQTQAMASTSFQQYRPEDYHESQHWPQQTAGAYSGQSASNEIHPRGGIWRGASMFDRGLQLNNNPHIPAQIMSESMNYSYPDNNALSYPTAASLSVSSKGCVQDGHSLWFPHGSIDIPRDVKISASEPEPECSYSPKSFVSEAQASDILPFTPETIVDTASEVTDDICYSAEPYALVKSASWNALAASMNAASTFDFSGLPRPLPVPSSAHTVASYGYDGHGSICDESNSQFGSEYSCSQKSSPEISPWYTKGTSGKSSIIPYRPRNPPTSSASTDSLSHGDQAHCDKSISQGYLVWGGACTNRPTQNNFREHDQTRQIVDSTAQRKADDQILLEGKRDGLTYKEILKKMHTKCAESTLRGRYRSLSKPRRERVRKPVWHKKDIELLEEFVQRDLDRINASYLHHTMAYGQRLAKVQWKKVADSIHANGGSYHFGNSTCKRKWLELNPQHQP